jgi:hypothetical protein
MMTIKFRLLTVLVVLGLSALACKIPGAVDPQPKLISPSPTLTPLVQFLGGDAPPRDAQKIIVLSVVPDSQFNIDEIVLDLPETLSGAQVFVSDQEIEGLREGDTTRYHLDGAAAGKKATLLFKVGDTLTAFCVIDTAALLSPSGDCSW